MTSPKIKYTAAAFVLAGMLAGGISTASAGEAASIVRGGLLYDKWYAVIKAPKPEQTHKAWPASNTKKKGDATQRCKACHGWDYMGKDGAYGSGSYKTGISGLRGLDGGDPAKVVTALKDDTHGFGNALSDQDMSDLALFVTKGQTDMDALIDRATKKAKGDAAKGAPYYNTVCANCHGMDGKLPKDMEPLGPLSNKNPWEVLHKVLIGQPGEPMPAMFVFDRQIAADILAHMQTLPE